MAKSSKSARSDRQKVIDDIRRKQKRAESRQGMVIVAVCVLIALGIVGVAAYNPVRTAIEKARYSGTPLEEIGADADVCGDIITKEATGAGEHVPTGTQVEYEDSPPAFGSHWNEGGVAPDPPSNRFYTADGRPELEALLHNLEHGYTILWYDETVAEDSGQLAAIKAMAATLDENDTNGRLKFKAVPWTDEDGEPFPDGQHVALTHWTMDLTTQKQQGVWQYCSEPSGAALEKFMDDYPFTNSPEPYVP